jgi:hypothetical protein
MMQNGGAQSFDKVDKLGKNDEAYQTILVVMLRKLSTERVRRFSGWREATEIQRLRDTCYIWSLMHAADMNRLYPEADLIPELKELDDRAQDIWAPLLTIAYLVDARSRGGW